jgi:hypothetical protein
MPKTTPRFLCKNCACADQTESSYACPFKEFSVTVQFTGPDGIGCNRHQLYAPTEEYYRQNRQDIQNRYRKKDLENRVNVPMRKRRALNPEKFREACRRYRRRQALKKIMEEKQCSLEDAEFILELRRK